MTRDPRLFDLVIVASWVVGALLLGIVADRLVRAWLRRAKARPGLDGGEIAARALHHVILLWFLAAGVAGAAAMLPLDRGVGANVRRGLTALVAFSVTIAVARLAGGFVRASALRYRGGIRLSSILVTLVKLVIYAVGAVVVLQSLGVTIAPVLTALGVGGLAVALALQDTLSNLFAGIHLIASRKINPGDYIRLDDDHEGYVVDINWRNTTIRELTNNMVIVPNAKMAQAVLTNFARPADEFAIFFDVGVDYDSDLEHVERVTAEVAREVARTVEGASSDFEPLIRFRGFEQSAVGLRVIIRVRGYAEQFLVRHELVKRVHERYRREGIGIPFPVRTVKLDDSTRRALHLDSEGARGSRAPSSTSATSR